MAWYRVQAPLRCCVNYSASALALHMRDYGLTHMKNCIKIDFERQTPILFCQLHQRATTIYARIIAHHINIMPQRYDIFDTSVNGGPICQIQNLVVCLSTRVADGPNQCIRTLAVAIEHPHMPTFTGKSSTNSVTDTTGAASDKYSFAFKSFLH